MGMSSPQYKRNAKKEERMVNKRCQKPKELQDVQWGKYRQLSSQPAIASHKRTQNNYSRLRKVDQRNFEKNIVNKAGENLNNFHRFIMSHLSLMEQVNRWLRNSDVKLAEGAIWILKN